ncbi:MAG TPA: CATRA conflict system CASPASE/TPR repeat-associated protein, partial [Candidatus Dormibacteraeota bacterium]|nr:CATRA conflict system CASPASE/TPR repeat-associated protein [Candidatus Dormibacteraeota bacterium]
MTSLAEPGLVVHVFAPLDGPDADVGYGDLRDVWFALRDRLGMDRAIPGTTLPVEPPADRRTLAGPGAVAGVTHAAG